MVLLAKVRWEVDMSQVVDQPLMDYFPKINAVFSFFNKRGVFSISLSAKVWSPISTTRRKILDGFFYELVPCDAKRKLVEVTFKYEREGQVEFVKNLQLFTYWELFSIDACCMSLILDMVDRSRAPVYAHRTQE